MISSLLLTLFIGGIYGQTISISCNERRTGSIGWRETVTFTFTNPVQQKVTFTNCDSDFDTQLRVRRGSRDITSNSDNNCDGDDCVEAEYPCSNSNKETMTFSNLAADTYELRMSPYFWSSGGNYEMRVICSSAPTSQAPTTKAPTTTTSTTKTPTTRAPTTTTGQTRVSTTTTSTTTTSTTTTSQTIDCCAKRCRKPWNTMSQSERSLYINGFKSLADAGTIQAMSNTHSDLFNRGIHNTPLFLPWHRVFLYDLENKIRALGPEYRCFALPYWDWSAEPTPAQVSAGTSGPVIFQSGLGGDPDGECLSDGSPFSTNPTDGNPYEPADARFTTARWPWQRGTNCLNRDADYRTGGDQTCLFTQASALMSLIDDSFGVHGDFTVELEGIPHAYPHICIDGNMGGGNSPDDPAFYLHHCFVDFLYALWQDCYNYDGKTTISESNEYAGTVTDILELTHNANPTQYTVSDVVNQPDLDVIYAKGLFWDNAQVDDEANCGVNINGDTINSDWFYFEGSNRRRLRSESQEYAKRLYDEMKASGNYANQRELKHAWSIKVCQYEQRQNFGQVFEIPAYFDDCSDLNVNPETNDIDVSKEYLLSRNGITDVMKKTIKETYDYALMSQQLLKLCSGCFDPFCDKSSLRHRCSRVNRRRRQNIRGGSDNSAAKKFRYNKGNNNGYDDDITDSNKNVYIFYMIIGSIIILLICNAVLMLKMCNRNIRDKSIRYKPVQFEDDTEFADSDANLIS